MVQDNSDWFLYTMLFYHTRHVIKRQNSKNMGNQDGSDSDSGDSGSDDFMTASARIIYTFL